jgi:putative sigma-54 modulation protein
MKIMIQTPGFKADQKLVDFVNEKLEKLSRFSDRILEAQVTLKLDKSETRENKISEIRLVIPGNDLFAVKHSTSFEEATTKTIEALKHQVATWKEKIDAR